MYLNKGQESVCKDEMTLKLASGKLVVISFSAILGSLQVLYIYQSPYTFLEIQAQAYMERAYR